MRERLTTPNSASVTQVIADRILRESKPRHRDDPYKIGLVIEGGGMRGVVSGGMVTGLQALEALNAFDALYTVSAGTAAGMYFKGNQTPEGTSIYYEELNTGEFINFKRATRKKPIVDIPFFTHHVAINIKPLNWELVADTAIPIHTYVSEAQKGEVIDINSYDSREDVHNTLHYTTRIPVLAGYPIQVGDRFYTDGSAIVGGIPLRQALDDDCTHILALLTRPEGADYYRSALSEKIFALLLGKKYPNLVKGFMQGNINYNEALKIIKQGFAQGVLVEGIKTPVISEVFQLEQKTHKLVKGAEDGYNAVLRKFEEHELPVNTEVQIKR